MLVALDVQHTGKPFAWGDRGAAYGGLVEVELTRAYVNAADRELRRLGHEVVVLQDGTYGSRQTRADSYGASVYVACHINAGLAGRKGDRGEVYHWPGSTRGARIAAAVSVELLKVCPWTSKAIPAETDRVRSTISGVKATALCFEPAFLDGEAGLPFLRNALNVEAIGVALARGIAAA